jgi:hypothetical protein
MHSAMSSACLIVFAGGSVHMPCVQGAVVNEVLIRGSGVPARKFLVAFLK